MPLSRILSPAALVLPLALLTVGRAPAEDSELSRNTMRGVQGVQVVGEDLKDGARQDGLNEKDIQTDAELKLRLAGIKVLTQSQQRVTTPGFPFLYIHVNTMLNRGGTLYAVNCEVSLIQEVLLARDPSISYSAATWSTTAVGTIGKDRLPQERDSIKDLVDQFLNAYLAVNPKSE